MKANIILLFATLVASCVSIKAQEVYTLPQLYALADQNSHSLKALEALSLVAEEQLSAAKNARLPDIGLQASVSYNGRGLISDRNFSNLKNAYIPEFGNAFALKVAEVIYSGGAISSAITLGELNRQMAKLSVEKNRQEVRFLITGQYLDLYKSRNSLQVVRQNIRLTEDVLRQMRLRYEQGMALKNDITRYELQLESLRLQATRLSNYIKILNHQICLTVCLPADTEIQPDSALLQQASQTKSLPYWQQYAAAQNLQLQQAQLSQQISDSNIRLARSQMLPRISLFAENYLNGPITIEIPAINKNFNYWFVGIGLQYQISSLFKNKHNLRAARQARRQADEQLALAHQQVDISIQAAHTDLLTSQADLRTQEKSTQLARENYQVVANRYQNGLALITDMIDASNIKLQAELQQVNARITQIYQYYRLLYLCHSL